MRAVIKELAVRMAKDNAAWGYTRIQGALSNLGYTVGCTSIARILQEHGVDALLKREMSWATLLRAHWDVIAAADLFAVEVWVKQTLVRYHVLFAIELATRRVKVLGIPRASGITVVRLPPRSPNLNAYAERFVRSIQEECLGRMIFFSERQVGMAANEYMEHYHVERNRQGLGNALIDRVPEPRN